MAYTNSDTDNNMTGSRYVYLNLGQFLITTIFFFFTRRNTRGPCAYLCTTGSSDARFNVNTTQCAYTVYMRLFTAIRGTEMNEIPSLPRRRHCSRVSTENQDFEFPSVTDAACISGRPDGTGANLDQRRVER